MKDKLLARLAVLAEGRLLDPVRRSGMERFTLLLEEKKLLRPSREDELVMMSTHIAMALGRAESPVAPLDEGVLAELKASPYYPGALLLWEECAFLWAGLPHTEKPYILVHFCNLLAPEEQQ